MIEKKNEKLGVSFTLPDADKVTVRQQMEYLSEAAFAFRSQFIERLWLAALTLAGDWKCDLIPDPEKVDFDKETNPRIVDIVFFVAMETKQFIDGLERVPKN